MSYHNDPYRVDYLKIYPCLKERPDVLEVLKKSDRKMKYMEVDLKSEQRRKNAENGAESYVPSKEDSLERLVYSAKCQFADDAEGVEDAVIRKDNLFRLRAALDQLSEEERALIHALFFDERSERELEEMMGVHKKISDLSSQNQTLAFLKQQGLVDPDIFISKTNELTKQLRQAKLEKEKLVDAESDMTALQTRDLIDLLEGGPEFLDSFDAELFGELIEKIIIESNDSVRFCLKNGLELRESIERTVR